jgi:hypothetical protein
MQPGRHQPNPAFAHEQSGFNPDFRSPVQNAPTHPHVTMFVSGDGSKVPVARIVKKKNKLILYGYSEYPGQLHPIMTTFTIADSSSTSFDSRSSDGYKLAVENLDNQVPAPERIVFGSFDDSANERSDSGASFFEPEILDQRQESTTSILTTREEFTGERVGVENDVSSVSSSSVQEAFTRPTNANIDSSADDASETLVNAKNDLTLESLSTIFLDTASIDDAIETPAELTQGTSTNRLDTTSPDNDTIETSVELTQGTSTSRLDTASHDADAIEPSVDKADDATRGMPATSGTVDDTTVGMEVNPPQSVQESSSYRGNQDVASVDVPPIIEDVQDKPSIMGSSSMKRKLMREEKKALRWEASRAASDSNEIKRNAERPKKIKNVKTPRPMSQNRRNRMEAAKQARLSTIEEIEDHAASQEVGIDLDEDVLAAESMDVVEVDDGLMEQEETESSVDVGINDGLSSSVTGNEIEDSIYSNVIGTPDKMEERVVATASTNNESIVAADEGIEVKQGLVVITDEGADMNKDRVVPNDDVVDLNENRIVAANQITEKEDFAVLNKATIGTQLVPSKPTQVKAKTAKKKQSNEKTETPASSQDPASAESSAENTVKPKKKLSKFDRAMAKKLVKKAKKMEASGDNTVVILPPKQAVMRAKARQKQAKVNEYLLNRDASDVFLKARRINLAAIQKALNRLLREENQSTSADRKDRIQLLVRFIVAYKRQNDQTEDLLQALNGMLDVGDALQSLMMQDTVTANEEHAHKLIKFANMLRAKVALWRNFDVIQSQSELVEAFGKLRSIYGTLKPSMIKSNFIRR